MAKKKRHRGHYCWACSRVRANERFSGGGHKHHVCRECQKLGRDELAYRQAVRDIDRCLKFGGGIRRNQRKAFDRFLQHANSRVREYAQQIELEMQAERAAWREAMIEDERVVDEYLETVFQSPRTESEKLLTDEDIPF